MVPLIVGGLASIFYDAATDVMAKFFSIKGTQ
jgi:hypothetical protein